MLVAIQLKAVTVLTVVETQVAVALEAVVVEAVLHLHKVVTAAAAAESVFMAKELTVLAEQHEMVALAALAEAMVAVMAAAALAVLVELMAAAVAAHRKGRAVVINGVKALAEQSVLSGPEAHDNSHRPMLAHNFWIEYEPLY